MKRFGQEGFAEILEKPAGPDDGPVGARRDQHLFRLFGLFLAPAGQQDHALYTGIQRRLDKCPDRLQRPRHRKIRVISDVNRPHPRDHRPPGFRRVPIER